MDGIKFKISEDIAFCDLMTKVESAFCVKLLCLDDEGRYIAKGISRLCSIELVDKTDRSSELLCDDHYILKLGVICDKYSDDFFEENMKKILYINNIVFADSIRYPFSVD